MDVSTFSKADWLKIGGGAGFFVFGWFEWASLDGFGGGGNFTDWVRGWMSWLLVIGVGVVTVLLSTGKLKADAAPWPLVQLAAAGVAVLFMLTLVLFGPDKSGIDLDRGLGLWLSFLAAVASLVGGVLGFQDAGGNLGDLADVDKLKAAFDQGGSAAGSTPPPPPPPSAAAPPPPPVAPPAPPVAPPAPSATDAPPPPPPPPPPPA